MAFSTGTANNSTDLWNKLIAFLTTNADLVANGEAWQIVNNYTESGQPRVVLKGVGASGNEAIYVGLARTDSVTTDGNNIRLVGMTGYLPDATAWNEHVNVSPEVRLWLDSNPMKYWFVANGRRFSVVVNMSTVYQTIYAGFFLPYANPLSYPYPMFIGGTSSTWSGTNAVDSWRSQSTYHAHYMYGPFNTISGNVTAVTATNGFMLSPGGSWLTSAAAADAAVSIKPKVHNNNDPDGSPRWGLANAYTGTGTQRLGSESVRARITQNFGGGYTLENFTLIQTSPSVETYGVLDGVYSCPGVGNAAENIVSIDSVDHLIVQNVWRTTTADYWALRLE
ncbi:hypothetical protein WKW50_16520 [Ochrobactrum sp. GPK 3]